ncbi:MAG: hypothetical protein ABIF08_00920 [Nanoarchaeota archaeon]
MVYHPGRVLKVFKDITGKNAQATVEFWDENIHTLKIEKTVADKVKEDSFVLVDYYPTRQQPHRPNFLIVNVIKDSEANEIWRHYKQLLEKRKAAAGRQKQRNVAVNPQNSQNMPGSEHTYFG